MAIALGAVHAGVKVSWIPAHLPPRCLKALRNTTDGWIQVEGPPMKRLPRIAAGFNCGARSMVTMKQVGLNVASDPLMSLGVIGTKGGMVVVVADDPGPISSQTEQDTRHFESLPIFLF